MKRHSPRRGVATCLSVLALLVAATATSNAQTWHWNYVTRSPNAAPVAAESTVALAAGELRLTYTVPLQHRQVVIEACHASIGDVQSATTVHEGGRTYFLVQLKPSRAASCASGKRPAVALPTDDERAVTGAVDAINRSCCTTAHVAAAATPVAKATPRVRPTPAPKATLVANATPSATPSPAASPAIGGPPQTRDWVENAGVFSFVRVRNTGPEPVRIRGVEIFDCRDAAFGCGASARELALAPRAVATIATVASTNGRATPAFGYHYTAARVNGGNGDALSRSGSSDGSAGPRQIARMSPQEIRAAEAGALNALRPPAPQASGVFAPPRLIKRGSSRLAIGQTGTAMIRLMIGETGIPLEATIVSISNRRLTAAAIETAVSSSFTPATQDGKPVAAKYIATFSFDGEDPATAAIPLWKRSPPPSNPSAPAMARPTAEPAAPPQPAPPQPAAPQAATPEPAMPQPATLEPATPEPAPPLQPSPQPGPPTPPAPLPATSALPEPTPTPTPTP